MVPLETAVTRVGDGPSPQFPQCPADRDRHPAEGGWTEMSTDNDVGRPSQCAVVGAGRIGTALASAFRAAGIDVDGPLGRDDAVPPAGPVLLCVPDGQIVVGGIFIYDTWEPAGPNALSLATLSYYQTFLNKQVELKLGYLNNSIEFWGPFLAGSLASSIFGSSANIPVEAGINAYARTTPGINIKFNGPDGFYDKIGIQRASSPDGPFAEKTANPSAELHDT